MLQLPSLSNRAKVRLASVQCVGGDAAARVIAPHLHGVYGLNARLWQPLPDTESSEKFSTAGADGVDPGIPVILCPCAVGSWREAPFDNGNRKCRASQRERERAADQGAPDDRHINLNRLQGESLYASSTATEHHLACEPRAARRQ